MSPSIKLRFGCCHLQRSCIVKRYSFLHLVQNKFTKYWTQSQRRCMLTSFFWKFPGGRSITADFVVRRWLGGNGCRSVGSFDANVNGLELNTASSHMRVLKGSSSRRSPWSCIRPAETFLVVLICRSQTPPMHVASSWRVEQPFDSFPTKLHSNIVVIHFLYGLKKFFICTNKVGTVITSYRSNRVTSSYETTKGLNERIRFEWVRNFNVHCPAY